MGTLVGVQWFVSVAGDRLVSVHEEADPGGRRGRGLWFERSDFVWVASENGLSVLTACSSLTD